MEDIVDEKVIKLSVWKKKNEVEHGDLLWGMLEREKRWIDRRSYFIREKAILLRICEVIDNFIVPLHLCPDSQSKPEIVAI